MVRARRRGYSRSTVPAADPGWTLNGGVVRETDERTLVMAAARRLGDIPPRTNRWTHLPLCVLDAVYSIGARYEAARTVHAYADLAELPHVLESAAAVEAGAFATTEQPVSRLQSDIERVGSHGFALQIRNRQRTSPRGGVLKAEAARQYAVVLSEHDVERLTDVTKLMTDPDHLAEVEGALAAVPGHGQHGVRVSYLWMLAGDDQHVKPDRMVVGWLSGVLGRAVAVREAIQLVTAAAGHIGVSHWELDHAIWKAQRALGRRSQGT